MSILFVLREVSHDLKVVSVTALSHTLITPRPDDTINIKCHRMKLSTFNLNYSLILQSINQTWNIVNIIANLLSCWSLVRVISSLALSMTTPDVNFTLSSKTDSVMVTTSHLRNQIAIIILLLFCDNLNFSKNISCQVRHVLRGNMA